MDIVRLKTFIMVVCDLFYDIFVNWLGQKEIALNAKMQEAVSQIGYV